MNDLSFSIDLGAVAYGVSAAANVFFFVLLLTSWRGRKKGAFLVWAVALSAIWAIGLATVFRSGDTSFAAIYALEIMRDSGWLFFLLSVLGVTNIRHLTNPRFPLPFVVILVISINLILCFVQFLQEPGIPVTGKIASLPLLGLLGLVLVGIVLIEQIYRNSSGGERWALKFLCVGLGAMFAYDIYMFADSFMFHRINTLYWDARGVISLILVPLLAISISRDPRFSIDLFVSRHVVFYSSALIAVGVYLLLMSAGGYYIREYGGTWGGLFRVVFVFGALLFLVLILLSAIIRAKVKVFVVKHFFSNKYDYRIEWLRLIGALSDGNESTSLQMRAIKCLMDIISARGGCIWLVSDPNRFAPGASLNLKISSELTEPCDSDFSRFLGTKKWVVDITRELPAGFVMPSWLDKLKGQGAWLVIPLIDRNLLFGFVVLTGGDGRYELGWEDFDFLKTVGRQITSYLALENTASKLMEAKQFDAYNKLAAFVMHDIKNLVSQLSLVTQNAAMHRNNPLFVRDAMQTVENSVKKMNVLLDKLRQSHNSAESIGEFDVRELMEGVVSECSARLPIPVLRVDGGVSRMLADRERLSMIMRHLISNSQDATADEGNIFIDVSLSGDLICIAVKDDGCGMSVEFVRDKLFRPFETTKANRGMGIGAYEVREYVHAAGGAVEVESTPGCGTCISIMLPVTIYRTEAHHGMELKHG